MREAVMAAAVFLTAAAPAEAQGFARGEDLTLRIALEECLGYVRHGRAPFQDWPILSLPPEGFPERSYWTFLRDPNWAKSGGGELSAPQASKEGVLGFVAWGSGRGMRRCSFTPQDHSPLRLRETREFLVRREGFLGRFDAHARKKNLDPLNPDIYLERLGAPSNLHIWRELEEPDEKSFGLKIRTTTIVLTSAVKLEALSRIVSITVEAPEKPTPLRSGPPARFRGPGR